MRNQGARIEAWLHSGDRMVTRRSQLLKIGLPFLVVGILVSALAFNFERIQLSKKVIAANQILALNGAMAMSEEDLVKLVREKNLLVYWSGPVKGNLYVISALTPDQVSIRYLPAGIGLNDGSAIFRILETYRQPGAFAAVRRAAKQANSVGFVNIDGNAIFYNKATPRNIYMGIKGQDVQVQIFDPIADQSLGMAITHGVIRRIM